jgi:hypothetical protein
VTGHATPEEAVRAEDSVPSEYARLVKVDYSPNKDYAVVLLEYNEPPTVEPYVVLCESTPSGWVQCQGGSAGGLSWTATRGDGTEGVEVAWGQAPTVRWDVRASRT